MSIDKRKRVAIVCDTWERENLIKFAIDAGRFHLLGKTPPIGKFHMSYDVCGDEFEEIPEGDCHGLYIYNDDHTLRMIRSPIKNGVEMLDTLISAFNPNKSKATHHIKTSPVDDDAKQVLKDKLLHDSVELIKEYLKTKPPLTLDDLAPYAKGVINDYEKLSKKAGD